MNRLPNLLFCSLLLLFLTILPACAPHTNQSGLSRTGTKQGLKNAQAEDEDGDDLEAGVEPEQTAQEELADLDRPGFWELTARNQQSSSPARSGLDLSAYDFPISVNKEVLYYLEQFQGKQRNYFSHWLARSTIYLPAIEPELEKAGLPKDLAYLAMIESGFNPVAYSPAHACGLWQFISGTGRIYGLTIDRWVDERREPKKATKAAIRYLSHLYGMFGDWYLAVAAYNTGEKNIENAIETYNTRDFWELAAAKGVYLETRRYVPKLIAAIIIARNPQKYGFQDVAYKKPQRYDEIKVPGGVDLDAVAVTANAPLKTIKELNTELRKGITPPGAKSYLLRVPQGSKALIAANLHRLQPVSTTTYLTHTIKRGDTLTKICRRYGISKTTLLKANNLRSAKLRAGKRLQIPTTATKYVLLKKNERPSLRLAKAAGHNRPVVLHKVKRGETLSKIANQYQVSIKNIKRWNKISNHRTLQVGQQLALYTKRSAPEAMTVLTDSSSRLAKNQVPQRRVTVLADSKKRSTKTKQVAKSRQKTWYTVKSGDSLWTIAKKFGTSAKTLKRWNNLKDSQLHAGNKLIVRQS